MTKRSEIADTRQLFSSGPCLVEDCKDAGRIKSISFINNTIEFEPNAEPAEVRISIINWKKGQWRE